MSRGLSGQELWPLVKRCSGPDWPFNEETKRINFLISLPRPPVTDPILQISKMRFREMKSPTQGHTAGKWKNQHWNPVPFSQRPWPWPLTSSQASPKEAGMHVSPGTWITLVGGDSAKARLHTLATELPCYQRDCRRTGSCKWNLPAG